MTTFWLNNLLFTFFRWAGSREGEVQSNFRRTGPDLCWNVGILKNRKKLFFHSAILFSSLFHFFFPTNSVFQPPSSIHSSVTVFFYRRLYARIKNLTKISSNYFARSKNNSFDEFQIDLKSEIEKTKLFSYSKIQFLFQKLSLMNKQVPSS